MSPELPEVIRPQDARGERPENAAGIGGFYRPEVWTLPLFPGVRVLYAGLCTYLGHREIDRKDLRNTPKGQPEAEIERPRRASPSRPARPRCRPGIRGAPRGRVRIEE